MENRIINSQWVLVVFILLSGLSSAQAPSKMSYQTVIRNNSNSLVMNSMIGIRISILQSSSIGSAIYIETHSPTTNINGLATFEIGGGVVEFGNFTTIDWANGPYFIKTEADPTGGTNYSIIGVSQLLSVPYALYAENSGSSLPGPTGPPGVDGQNGNDGLSAYDLWLGQGNIGSEVDFINSLIGPQGPIGLTGPQGSAGSGGFNHFIGEYFGGGIIFHLWKDNLGIEHGLIVALVDQSTSQAWSNVQTTMVGSSAQSSWDGYSNSIAITGQLGHTNSAAKLCLDLVSGGQSDWYLPALDELHLLFQNRYNVNRSLSIIVGAEPLPLLNMTMAYLSSTEQGGGTGNSIFTVVNHSGAGTGGNKSSLLRVRAIRAF